MKSKLLILAGCILLPLCVGFVGSIFTTPAIGSWYAFLSKPSFNPPSWIFAPVWTLLYVLMGIALFLVYQKAVKNKLAWRAAIFFLIHLFFNFSWSIVFFGLKMIPLALANIVFLWLMIVCLVVLFWRIDKRASMLLWPYLAWVSFASVLNYFLMVLN
jgi:tryptophan-rich sensory protein